MSTLASVEDEAAVAAGGALGEARVAAVEGLLEADVRFSPAEIAFARARLASVRFYLEAGQGGAARYEFRDLVRRLERVCTGPGRGGRIPLLVAVPTRGENPSQVSH